MISIIWLALLALLSHFLCHWRFFCWSTRHLLGRRRSSTMLTRRQHSMPVILRRDSDDGYFLTKKEGTDIEFIVQGQRVHASTAVLSMWSPVFTAMFRQNFKEKHATEIPLPGKELTSFHTFIKMLHPPFQMQDEITSENVLSLYVLAREYQMDKVLEKCQILLRQQTPTLELLEEAEEHKMDFLREYCLSRTPCILRSLLDEHIYKRLRDFADVIQASKLLPDTKLELYHNIVYILFDALAKNEGGLYVANITKGKATLSKHCEKLM